MTKTEENKIINKDTGEIQIPKIGEWCNIGDKVYEVIEISEAGVVKIETILFGEIKERKLVLKTLIEQIDKKGFYIPDDGKILRRKAMKDELTTVAEIHEEPKKELNDSQKLFCKYYLDPKHYGNGIQAYLKVYKCSYETAKHGASRLLRNVHICTHLATMLDSIGFNPANIDKQLLHVANQMSDLPSKMRAISEANKIWGRITQNVHHSGAVANSDLKSMSTAELVKAKEEMKKEELERENEQNNGHSK